MLEQLLRHEALQQVAWTHVGVTVGPGTFTGLRIGLSTARTLAQVWSVPVVPLSTLSVVACNVMGYALPLDADGVVHEVLDPPRRPPLALPLLVALDARKGEVFGARFAAGPTAWPSPVWGPEAVRPTALDDPNLLVTGSALKRWALPGTPCPAIEWWPHAAHVALAAAGCYGEQPQGPWAQVEAFYLRPPDVEIPRFMKEGA
jgi:tRNA threonylcarbamoyladenosine biosynthesis protein TsaB